MSLIAISTDERLLSYLGGIILVPTTLPTFCFSFFKKLWPCTSTGILQNIARAIA